jgi:hypothetical protein
VKAFRLLFITIISFAQFITLARADTLILKTGENVTGSFDGGTARVVKFRTTSGSVKEYDILTIQQILFSDDDKTAVLPTTPTATNPSTASNAAYTFPAGTKLTVLMIDSIGGENQTEGSLFLASLDAPMMNGGVEVIPKGADVWGRVTGSAPLGLELTQLFFNGNTYSIRAEGPKIEKTEIPADAKLEFELKAPLVITPREEL